MADTTTVLAMPFPEGSDANDVPADIQALAERIDEVPGIESLTSAEIAALTSGQKPAGRVVWNSTTSKLQVSNGSTFANIDAAALLLAGGTMTGNIAMGSNKVTGLAAATTNGDAVRYEQALLLAGGTMSGAIAMGGNKVTGLGAASANGDAVRYEQLTALGEWAAWTPSLTASGSNPTASNVSAESRYTQIGKTVMGVGYMDVTAAGSGTYRVSLPVAPRSSSSNGFPIGRARMIYTDGSAYAYDMALLKAASQSYCVMATHDYASETTSYCDNQNWSELRTHGSSNVYLVWQFTYEAA